MSKNTTVRAGKKITVKLVTSVATKRNPYLALWKVTGT